MKNNLPIRIFTILMIVAITTVQLNAQELAVVTPEVTKVEAPAGDPTVPLVDNRPQIIVVPFSPYMFQSTGEFYLCQSNNMNRAQLNDLFRRSFESTITANLQDYYRTGCLFKTTDGEESASDLYLLYRIMKYKKTNQSMVGYHKGYPSFKLPQIFGPNRVRWGSDCATKQGAKPHRKNHPYMSAVVADSTTFAQIQGRHEGNYYLMINQFELYTRFKNCTDLRGGVFQRDIFIHYTLVDINGKELDGGVVGTTFQGNTNDLEVIQDKTLGELSGLIIDNVRRRL